ncbi:MAG: formyltransferase family protein [Acidobacteriaceae bacterium]
MRIVFLTQDDPIYIFPFFETFFAVLQQEAGTDKIQVCSVLSCRTMGGRKRFKLIKELVVLYGYSGFSRLLWLQLKARVLSSQIVHSVFSKPHTTEQLCSIHNVHFERINSPNLPEVIAKLKAQNPDVLVSVACPYVLDSKVLAIPVLTSINIHHAPLPQYKGMMPTFWQMYHGESTVGMTIHTMVERVDEGKILLQESLTIDPDESLHQIIQRSKRYGAGAMLRVLKGIQGGTVSPIEMPLEKSSYFTFPTKQEMQEFHRRRLRAI